MDQIDAILKARQLFLRDDNLFGCAETTFLTLKAAYGLPEAGDPSAAMALNGGVAYSGGICGAISGAALAVGLLAGQRIADHRQAKKASRRLIARTMERFAAMRGAVNCRDLTGVDLRDEARHHAFIAGGAWRTTCMQSIEFTVRELAGLANEETWRRAVQAALD